MGIIALIPAYNEADHIADVVARTKPFLPVVVVDDGSKDDTANQAETAGATVLRQIPNQGKGAALRMGFRWAMEHGCDGLIMLDADGQHDPAEIPAFLDKAKQADLIIGSRNFSQMPTVRRFSNTIGRWMFSAALGHHVPDNQSGYRFLSSRMIEATLEGREGGFEFEVEMIVLCVLQKYTLEWVPIRTIYGDEKSHIKPGPHIVKYFRVVWRTWQARRHATKN